MLQYYAIVATESRGIELRDFLAYFGCTIITRLQFTELWDQSNIISEPYNHAVLHIKSLYIQHVILRYQCRVFQLRSESNFGINIQNIRPEEGTNMS